MRTIPEPALRAVAAFISLIDVSLGRLLQEIIQNGTFAIPKKQRADSASRIFTTHVPIDPATLTAVSETLLIFSNRPDALETTIESIGIYGAISFWSNFIAD